MPTINDLNDAWISAGQKVSDLDSKLNAAVLDDDFSKDDFTKMKETRDNLKAQRDAIKDQLDEARAAEVVKMDNKKDRKPLNKQEQSVEDRFVKDIKDMARGRFDATTATGSDASVDASGNGGPGLTIPQDIQTAINALVRQMATLQNLVNVENVTTNKGSRNYETDADVTPMVKVDEGAVIPDADVAKLHLVKYLISDYGAIFHLTNDLLNDTAENLLAWLEQQIARKDAVTRNAAIIAVLNNAPKKPTIAKFDDIKDLENNTLDPAIEATSTFLTNQSGYNVLSKVKDAEGRYMLQRDVTQPDQYVIDGHPVVRVADRWLPDVSGSHPLYFGDFKQAVTVFNRQQMNLLGSNIATDAFRTNGYDLRVIDRFDVEAIDQGTMAAGSFKTVANAVATTPAASGSASN